MVRVVIVRPCQRFQRLQDQKPVWITRVTLLDGRGWAYATDGDTTWKMTFRTLTRNYRSLP